VFIRALHWSISSARSIQSIPPHPISLRSIVILFTHLRHGLPRGLFPSGFPINSLYTILFSLCYMTCPSHPPIIQGNRPGPRSFLIFHNKLIFYGEELLSPCQTPKLAVRDCLFNIVTATLHI
jgi:hypothetical protein